jgi:hypothetical protein
MGLRPDGKRGDSTTIDFWKFFLEPEDFLEEDDKVNGDRYRRTAFEVAAGLESPTSLSWIPLEPDVLTSVRCVASLPGTPLSDKLFQRLALLNPAHRQVLLKAAAEWTLARYERGYQNWKRQREEWEKEKKEWEERHPELTEEVRQRFTEIFKELGIRDKRPRVCSWEHLEKSKDDCLYAGERIPRGRKMHGPLCIKFKGFLDAHGRDPKYKKHFAVHAKTYLALRRKMRDRPREQVEREFFKMEPKARWFPEAWKEYLTALGVKEDTVLNSARLPHCAKFSDDNDCEFNPHTELCRQYRNLLDRQPDLQALEAQYREWRRDYLSGPKKPSFRYPSSRNLPMPKIFGEDFFRVDFTNSILEVRLDDMPEGEFLPFGFVPWPTDYRPQPEDAEIASAHISFVGTRARVGFRFEVRHKESQFRVSQDEIDRLRSRKYPRKAEDQLFLDEARALLLESFQADDGRELKLLAVDLGETGASAALFEGRAFQKAFPLKIVKLDKLYDALPGTDEKKKEKKSEEEKKKERQRGLGKDHVGRHVESFAEGARRIAEARSTETVELGGHDMRRLSLHVRWMIRDWVRLNASQIIETAEKSGADLIVFESLRGFRAPGYDKLDPDKKRRLAFLAYGRIRRKVTEKAVERGMRVVTAPYLKSSQFCSECGREQTDKKRLRQNKRKRIFDCEYADCNYKCNSDENAARVLGRVFWGEIKLPVELPGA